MIAVLPFLLTYDPAAEGFGRVSERAPFTRWARDHGALYGLFAYLVLSAYAVRLARSRHPWRTAAWAAAAALFAGSLLAADEPHRGGGARRALLGRGARGVPEPRAGRRALRVGADRRRAAVPR